MGDEILETKEVTKMFVDNGCLTADEELAVDIMHRFNIDRDTMECMPAFDPHIKPIFSKERQK